MPVVPWFPIPVYAEKVEGEEFDAVQKDLFDVYSKVKFARPSFWTSDTHEISTSGEDEFFRTCVLTEHKAFDALNFISNHVIRYMHQIGCQEDGDFEVRQSWFTKTKKDKYAHLHDHGEFDISGVYYMQTNTEDGNIIFPTMHRRLASNYVIRQIASVSNTFPLETGVIALWPSMLWHSTEANKTDNERLSVSFNIKFK
tara:strand:- start:66 stop:662 length:597 start_codon:yes stop_codon:yes gene_type:complete